VAASKGVNEIVESQPNDSSACPMHLQEGINMDRRRLMTVPMTPEMANFSGKVHGGALLNLLDRVAFSQASRYSGRYTVTFRSIR
jgi:acyl-CoA hydrolase